MCQKRKIVILINGYCVKSRNYKRNWGIGISWRCYNFSHNCHKESNRLVEAKTRTIFGPLVNYLCIDIPWEQNSCWETERKKQEIMTDRTNDRTTPDRPTNKPTKQPTNQPTDRPGHREVSLPTKNETYETDWTDGVREEVDYKDLKKK